jgi:hypothetical protein
MNYPLCIFIDGMSDYDLVNSRSKMISSNARHGPRLEAIHGMQAGRREARAGQLDVTSSRTSI